MNRKKLMVLACCLALSFSLILFVHIGAFENADEVLKGIKAVVK